MTEKVGNMDDLYNRLAHLYDDISNEKIDVRLAAEMNNTAGKMINVAKVKLEYAALRKEKPDIEFLNE